ncbi:reverse transcriptase domain-containing protein [Tanacetum coccineum]
MADNRTMAQMLQAPIERYEDAIFVPPINANNFELKQPLINLVQSNKFTGRQDPHNHLRFFNKVTSTLRHPEVPNTSIKLLLFPFSLDGEARDWLDKEPPRSILTWDDLVSKFINQFFPPSKTTYLLTEITTSPTKTTKPSTNKGTFKRILRQYKMPRDGLAIIESKSKVRYSRSRPNDSRAITNAPSSPSNNSFEIQQMAALFEDKMNIRMSRFEKEISEKNATTPATVKAVKEVCVTCGSNHNFNHCLRASTEKVQNLNLENTAHVPPPEEEDSIFIEIPKPKAKKTVNVEIQDLNSPRPNSYPSKLPYPERMKVRENDKPSAQHSRFLKMFKQLRLEIGLKIALASGSFEDLGKISYPCALQKPSIGLVLSHSKASINFYTSFYLTRTTWLEALTPTRRMTPSLPIVPFAPDGYRHGSTTNNLPPSSSPVKTSDNFEKFADELAPLDSLPPGNDDSTLKKDLHKGNFQVYSNPLFEFDDNFKSSNFIHAIHDKNLVTLEENLKENNSSGTLLVFKEPSFLLPPPEPPDECLNFEKNVVLNEDFYQSKKVLPLNIEDVNSFTFIIWIFLPYFTYTKESPLIFSFRSENFVFDPGLIQRFLKPLVSGVVSRFTRASHPFCEN